MAEADARFVVYRSGLDAVGYARSVVAVDTGELKESIGVKYDVTGLAFALEAEADHASYVEYGTTRMGPRPFLGPSIERAAKEMEAKFNTAPLPSIMSLAARW